MKCVVKPYGDDGYTYLVKSRSRAGDHMVDLSCYGNLGACACEDFRITRLTLFKVAREVSDEYRCQHIKDAREYLLNALLDKLKGRHKLPPAAKGKISRQDLQNQARLGPAKEGTSDI